MIYNTFLHTLARAFKFEMLVHVLCIFMLVLALTLVLVLVLVRVDAGTGRLKSIVVLIDVVLVAVDSFMVIVVVLGNVSAQAWARQLSSANGLHSWFSTDSRAPQPGRKCSHCRRCF